MLSFQTLSSSCSTSASRDDYGTGALRWPSAKPLTGRAGLIHGRPATARRMDQLEPVEAANAHLEQFHHERNLTRTQVDTGH